MISYAKEGVLLACVLLFTACVAIPDPPSPDLLVTWDIQSAYATGVDLDISAYTSNPRSIDFTPDGSKMFVVGRGTENIVEYTLSVPWDLNTAEYTAEFDISDDMGSASQSSSAAHGLFFNKDSGTDMFVFNRNEIWQYELTNPWDITSASQTNYLDLSDTISRGHDIHFAPDGKRMYVEDRNNQAVYEYSLSTPWNVETLNLVYTLDISDEENAVRGIELNPDGTRMWLMDTGRREILQYDLHTPWHIESAQLHTTFDVSAQAGNPRGITWRANGEAFYVTETSEQHIYEYAIEQNP